MIIFNGHCVTLAVSLSAKRRLTRSSGDCRVPDAIVSMVREPSPRRKCVYGSTPRRKCSMLGHNARYAMTMAPFCRPINAQAPAFARLQLLCVISARRVIRKPLNGNGAKYSLASSAVLDQYCSSRPMLGPRPVLSSFANTLAIDARIDALNSGVGCCPS